MQGWSAQSPRPPAPCFSGSKAGSFEHSLIDPEPRIALEAHDPLVEVGLQPIGRKPADVQCALDAAFAREAPRVEVDRDIARVDALAVRALDLNRSRHHDRFGLYIICSRLHDDRRGAVGELDRSEDRRGGKECVSTGRTSWTTD